MRNKEMLKKISVKCVAAIMIAAMSMSPVAATLAFPVTVYATDYDTTDDVPEDNDGHRNLAAGDSLTTNTSTIHVNDGTIGTNAPGAVVEVNNKIVTDNYGDVANQDTGSVGTNHVGGTVSGTGSIGDNYGNVTGGRVTDNYASGTVTGGDSRITGDNFGTANGIGQVENNYANVTDANVTNNYSSGTVNENTKDNVQVDNNFGGTLGAEVDATTEHGADPGPHADKLNQTDPNPPAPAPQPEPPQDNGSNNDNSGSVDNTGSNDDNSGSADNSGSNNTGGVTYPEPFTKGFHIYSNSTIEQILAKLQVSTAEEALLLILSKLDDAEEGPLNIYFKSGGVMDIQALILLDYKVMKIPIDYDTFQTLYLAILRDDKTFLAGKTRKEKREIALRVCIAAEIDKSIRLDYIIGGYNRTAYINKALSNAKYNEYVTARLSGASKKHVLKMLPRIDFMKDNNLTPGAVTFVGGSFDGQDLENGMSVPTAGQAAADGTLQGGAAADGTLQGDAAVQAQQLQAMQASAAAQAAALQNLGLGQNPQDAVMAALLGQTGQTVGQQTAGDVAQNAMMQTDQANPAIDMANGGQDRGILFLPQNNGMAGIQENPTQVPAGDQDIAAILAALALANAR